MNIICSGNPTDNTVANAIYNIYPNSSFISRATGYDLTTDEAYNLFKKNIVNYNVFINSSYVCAGAQLMLLNLAVTAWMQADIKGHVISLGSTAEWTDDAQHSKYIESKRELRKRSLELNDTTGITGVKTTYIIVGGINDGKPGNEGYLNLESVAQAVKWVLDNPNRIALMQLEIAK